MWQTQCNRGADGSLFANGSEMPRSSSHRTDEATRESATSLRIAPETHRAVGELERKIRGEVRFDPGSRALYATDGSNYRQTPIGVVIPRSVEDVIETIAI